MNRVVSKKLLSILVMTLMVLATVAVGDFAYAEPIAAQNGDTQSEGAARTNADTADTVSVTVDCGEGHEAFTQKVSQAAETAGYEPTLSGTMLTLNKFPASDKDGNPVTVKSGAEVVLYELLGTVLGSEFVDWNDNDEELIAAALSTIDAYTNEHDIWNEFNKATEPIDDGQKYYILWAKPVSKIDLTIKTPPCGTFVSLNKKTHEYENGPVVTVSEDSEVLLMAPADIFLVNENYIPIENMEIKGDETYLAAIGILGKFGFYLHSEKPPTVTVNGAESIDLNNLDIGMIAADMKAEHEAADSVQENRVEATCEKAGSYDEVVYCKNHESCGKEISRVTKSIDALGHDWSAWKVIKAATTEAEGQEARTCSLCKETETRSIPKIDSQSSSSNKNGDDKKEETSTDKKNTSSSDKKNGTTSGSNNNADKKTTEPSKKLAAATGDENNTLIWLSIIAISTSGLAAIVLKKKYE